MLAIGAVCVLIAALMLAAFAPTPAGWRLLFAGVFLWTLSALFFGFVYLDPSPDE